MTNLRESPRGPREKLRNLTVAALSTLALGFVAFELVMHYHNHRTIVS